MNLEQRVLILLHTEAFVRATLVLADKATRARFYTEPGEVAEARARENEAWKLHRETRQALQAREKETAVEAWIN